jgi:putative addiction module component (TIGR02574 family)
MSPRAQQVPRKALQLPPKARADSAGTLLYSLDTREEQNVEDAWAAEIERRVAAVDSGKVKLVPWDRARRRLRTRICGAQKKR